jgi:hypothetical protein
VITNSSNNLEIVYVKIICFYPYLNQEEMFTLLKANADVIGLNKVDCMSQGIQQKFYILQRYVKKFLNTIDI